jgi:hypothetical protein
LTIKMNHNREMSREEIRAFLQASEGVQFAGEKKEEVYNWVNGFLQAQRWEQLGRADRGLVRRYMEKTTGLSHAQIARLITQYGQAGEVRLKRSRRRRFPTVYSSADVALLAQVDEAHETLSGPATQKILQRQFHDYGDPAYQRLGGDFGGTDLPPAQTGGIPEATPGLPRHARGEGQYRGAAGAAAGGSAWLHPSGHGASRRPGWSQGGVSHQCRGSHLR